MNVVQSKITVEEFKMKAINVEDKEGIGFIDNEERERKFWKTCNFSPLPIYGADMEGSLFDDDVECWNLRRLSEGTVMSLLENKMPGINIPYLYFGMWKAMFCWHTEDMDLFSINYHHYGSPKHWYVITSQYAELFERVAADYFPNLSKYCQNFLRHKTTLISPFILSEEYKIPINSVIQYQGEFIITSPYAYHSGFNHGFNCAESVNFGIDEWIDYGRKAVLCTCLPNVVYINMIALEAKYQLKKEGKTDITIEMIDERIKLMEKQYETLVSDKVRKNHLRIIQKQQQLMDDSDEEPPVALYTNEQHWMNPLFDDTDNLLETKKKRKKKESDEEFVPFDEEELSEEYPAKKKRRTNKNKKKETAKQPPNNL